MGEKSVHGAARLALDADVTAVAAMLDAFNREYDSPTPGTVFLASRITQLLAGSTTFIVVAGEPIRSVGVVTLRTTVWSDGLVALLDELYTEPASRGEGWGSHVLTFALAEAQRRGAVSMEIGVDEPDVDAHRFYERHGFPLRQAETGDLAYILFRDLLP